MTINSALRNVQGISNTFQGVQDVLGRLDTGTFWSKLKPASYRGIGFKVISGELAFGRRNAVHEYFGRDQVWVEDLGRSARRIQITGFLIGDDVIAQRDKLIAACEEAGDGELVHPTLGKRNVALLDVSSSERKEDGRVFEITFRFVEQGVRLYPQQAQVSSAVDASPAKSDLAAVAAFAKKAVAQLQQAAVVAAGAAREAAAFATKALAVTHDATSLVNLAASLPGEFGRVLSQLHGTGRGSTKAGGVTIQSLIGAASSARVAVASAAAALNAAGTNLGAASTDAFIVAAQTLTERVRVAVSTPGDAIRALSSMAAYGRVADGTGATLIAQNASADAFRRAAVASIVRAASEYQALSADEALSVRSLVLALIDAEILVAGNQAEDDVYAALRVLRAGVVGALTSSAGGLPNLITVTTASPMPAMALAQRLYGDGSRADELVDRARPKHPAFMPTSFQALNT